MLIFLTFQSGNSPENDHNIFEFIQRKRNLHHKHCKQSDVFCGCINANFSTVGLMKVFFFFLNDIKGRESYPHCDADSAVHVALEQPAVFGDASFVGAEGGCILARG